MSTNSRYAEDVSNRIERVIRSIRSNSPVLRSTSPVLRTSYVYESPVRAVSEIHRIDGTCRALIAENDLLRDQLYVQDNLIEENSRVHRDLSHVALENELLKSDNRKIPEYEATVQTLLRQSQDISVQLNQQSREALNWRVKFDESDNSAAKYRSLYQGSLSENDRLKAEIVELRRRCADSDLLRAENSRLHAANEDLASLRLKLSQEVVLKTEETVELKSRLKEVDVLRARLDLSEQDIRKLRELIAHQNETAADLRKRLDESQVVIAQLKVELSVIPGLEEKIRLGNRTSESLTTVISERESTIANLNRTIANLHVEISGLNKEVAHLSVSVEQNALYRSEIDRLLNEADGLKVKLARLIDVEHRLMITQNERESLNSLLTSKLDTIRELNLRIAHLEEQMLALEQLKSKVVLVVNENERLNQVVVDQARQITEWVDKYDNLERLYINVKETTEHLEIVKNRFQSAVKETESTSVRLRNSAYAKTDLYHSRYSAHSDARTAGSPTDLTNSPNKV